MSKSTDIFTIWSNWCILFLFEIVTPCLSQACQRATARLSTSADPFTQTCDHFLSKCGSDTILLTSGGRQRGQGIPGHPQNQMEKSVWTQTPKGEKKVRGLKEGRLQSRKTLLLQYLKGMLGETHTSTVIFWQSALSVPLVRLPWKKASTFPSSLKRSNTQWGSTVEFFQNT